MEKRIFIITCHNVYNAGASLQAFALQKHLQKTGNSVTIINYMPEYLRHYELFRMNPKYSKNFFTRSLYYVIKVPQRLLKLLDRRKINYDRFTKNYLKTTSKRFTSNDELNKMCPEGDIFIAGSDQIWNPILDNGKDPAFFLDFVPDSTKKISYAASFSVNEIPSEIMIKMKSWLSRFDSISVREESALELLEQMKLQGEAVVDPVFLLKSDEWDSICTSSFHEKYILVYDFDNDQKLKDFAMNQAKEQNCKIYSVLNCEWADKSFEHMGPDGFVSLVKNAESVISNSFHATAFSIIYNVPFYVFLRKWGINARMLDLIHKINLDNRLVQTEHQEFNDIDWDTVNRKMSQIVQNSKLFLERNLV